MTLAALAAAGPAAAQQADEPLYLRSPADLIRLDASNNSSELEVTPADPGAIPDPLPRSGALRTRLITNASVEIEVPYSSMVRYERFPQRLLRAASEHVAKREFGKAYDYFARLDADYPDEPGFKELFAKALRAEAGELYREGRHDHALALLGTLAERAPTTPGLGDAVDAIGDAIIEARWEENDYAGVRRTIDTLESQFKMLRLEVADRWRERIEEGAARVRRRAEELAAADRTRDALKAVSGAFALDPKSRETNRLLERLSSSDKTLWIGVWRPAPTGFAARLDTPAARREVGLVGGRLVSLIDYEPSGGDYEAVVGDLRVEDGRRRIALSLGGAGEAARLARLLLGGDPSASSSLALLRRRAARVSVDAAGALVVELRRAHPQPPAMLTDALPPSAADLASGRFRRVEPIEGSSAAARYERVAGSGAFDAVEEYVYDDAEKALEDLRSRQLHVLDGVPPWRLDAITATPGVRVAEMRLPTLHCLVMSPDTAIRARRELRRAVCYAIAREETLRSLILGGQERSGFEVLSAPLPLGLSLGDSLRYAYNDSVEPRPYEPRLAALLLTAARATDKSREAAATKAAAEGTPPPPGGDGPPVPDAVRLAHTPTPTVRLACEAIRDQLVAVGLQVELVEADEAELVTGEVAYDLRYAEVTIAEPLADVWRLLGPGGVAGECSPAMLAGLEGVLDATTGKDAAASLRDLHRVIFADLPVIPLWQTVEHFAYQEQLRGVPNTTVDLYQSIDQWRIGAGGSR